MLTTKMFASKAVAEMFFSSSPAAEDRPVSSTSSRAQPKLDVAQVLAALPSDRPLRVTSLDLENSAVQGQDPCMIGSLILRCPKLTQLRLSRNGLTDIDMVSLAGCIRLIQEQSGAQLRLLDLSGNRLSSSGCEAVALSFYPDFSRLPPEGRARHPYALDLSWNNEVGDLGVTFLAAELKTRCCVGLLRLRHTGLSSGGFSAIAAAATSLAELDLSANSSVCLAGFGALCDAMRSASFLRYLDFSWLNTADNSVSESGASDGAADRLVPGYMMQYFATAVRSSELRLRSLRLAGNKLDSESVHQLTQALREGGSQLADLDLSSNSLGTKWKGSEMRCLADLVPWAFGKSLDKDRPRGLVRLILNDNSLDDAAIALLSDGVRQGPTLEMLSLARNSIKDRGASCLADALREQRSLRGDGSMTGVLDLDVSSNPIADAGLEALADAALTEFSFEALSGPWGLARLHIKGHSALGRGQNRVRQVAKARSDFMHELLRVLSGHNPPRNGGPFPPKLLRVDELEEPNHKDVLAEASVARHWEEQFPNVAATNTSAESTPHWRLEDEMGALAEDLEDRQRNKTVYMAHLPSAESPQLVEESPNHRGRSSSWLPDIGSWFADEDAPDALDKFWAEDDPPSPSMRRENNLVANKRHSLP